MTLDNRCGILLRTYKPRRNIYSLSHTHTHTHLLTDYLSDSIFFFSSSSPLPSPLLLSPLLSSPLLSSPPLLSSSPLVSVAGESVSPSTAPSLYLFSYSEI